MAFTRAQATELLNKAEMQLYDDSRANGLRRLDRAALAVRVERARAARDRARDLLKRQRLAARTRGEGKDAGIAARTKKKEALLVEILQRFVDARRVAPATTKKATAKTAATKTAAAKRTAAKTSAARKAPVRKVLAKRAPAKKVDDRTPPVEKAAAAKGRVTRKAARRRVSPQRALENTRKLLEAKQERDRAPQPWQSLDPLVDHVPQPGYQSPQAAGKAQELHAGESRMASIHGSMATHDRRSQGKRDHRGDDD